jgi:hypothetical protein
MWSGTKKFENKKYEKIGRTMPIQFAEIKHYGTIIK